jgi:hypothetical protein
MTINDQIIKQSLLLWRHVIVYEVKGSYEFNVLSVGAFQLRKIYVLKLRNSGS